MAMPPDPFAINFDSIEIDPAHAPSRATIESALTACASPGQPGFYLIDDAGGRFVVDREFGVVSLRDEALLASERGKIHAVQLRVVESSGHSYVLDLQLRLTGIVPQMVGAEDFGFGGESVTPARASAPHVPWTAFAPVRGLQAKPPLDLRGAYGVLLATTLPVSNEPIAIAFGETVPSPASEQANWSLLV